MEVKIDEAVHRKKRDAWMRDWRVKHNMGSHHDVRHKERGEMWGVGMLFPQMKLM